MTREPSRGMSHGRRYEILSLLGTGGFGAVYRAKMTGDGGFTKHVALKILRQELSASSPNAQRLRDEARLLGLVHHRAIIQVDALVELDDRWTVVMELVEGRDLKAALALGPVPPGPALELGAEVAAALHAAWTTPGPDGAPLHLLHRDLKPANLCLTALGEVKVLDFGIGRAEGVTVEGITVDTAYGTPDYMAPERFALENGPAADVYALGASLFELLMGERLGRALNRPALHTTLVESRLAALRQRSPELPDEVMALLESALAWDPADRPEARELERRLVRARRRIEGPTLKDWAEAVIPPLLEAQRSSTPPITGTVLFEQGTRQTPTPLPLPEGPTSDDEQSTWMLPDSGSLSTHSLTSRSGTSSSGERLARGAEGRDNQLGEILAVIAAAERGEAGIVVLEGEAGIGKTRLAEEGGRLARERGFEVAWGRCWEAGEAPAGWPWSEALGRLYAADPEVARRLPGLHRAALRALVPELEAPSVAARSPEDERHRLASAVLAWLEAASERRPWWIVLDDLHAADPLTLFLVRGVGRALMRARVVLVMTWRDTEVAADPALSAPLSEVARRGLHLAVPRLDRSSTERLLRRLLPTAAPPTIEALWQSTLGHPLFVHEMARLVGARGPDALLAGNVPIGVRDAVRQRISRLPEATRALLEAAALLGPTLDPGLLSEVERVPEAEVLRRAREAERWGVLERSGTSRRFSHPLIRRAFDEAVDPERRATLHGAIAAALSARPDTPAALRARHWRASGPEHAHEATDAAIEASASALRRFAWEEALGVVADTRAALGGRDRALEARLLVAEGLVLVRLGRLKDGRALCLQAVEHARALGAPTLLASAALAYGGDVVEGEVNTTLIELLGEAYDALPPAEQTLRARVLARRAGAMQPAPDPEIPVAMARAALAIPIAEPDARLEVLVSAVSALVEQAAPAEYLPLNREAMALAERLGDGALRLRLLLRLMATHWELGDMAAARPYLNAYASAVEESGIPNHRRRLTALRGGLALAQGRWDEADARYEEAVALADASGDRAWSRVLRMLEGSRRLLRGDRRGALGFWEAYVKASREHGALHPMLALIGVPMLVEVGRSAEARALFEAQLPHLRSTRFGAFGLHAFSTATVALRDREAAALLYAHLLPRRANVTGAPVYLGFIGEPVEAPLGRLALLLERPEAVDHLQRAALWCDGAEAPAVKAWVLLDLAAALKLAGRHAEAAPVEAEALALRDALEIL